MTVSHKGLSWGPSSRCTVSDRGTRCASAQEAATSLVDLPCIPSGRETLAKECAKAIIDLIYPLKVTLESLWPWLTPPKVIKKCSVFLYPSNFQSKISAALLISNIWKCFSSLKDREWKNTGNYFLFPLHLGCYLEKETWTVLKNTSSSNL